MAHVTASFTPAAKGISVFWPPDPFAMPFRQMGNDAFTANWAGQGGTTTSGYITAALRWKAEQFAQAYLCVRGQNFNANGTESWDIAPKHPAALLLRYPCGITSSAMAREEFLRKNVYDFEFYGEAFSQRHRDSRHGYTKSLEYLPWRFVRVVRGTGTNYIEKYVFTFGGETRDIDPADMIHWKQGQDSANPGRGLAPLRSVLRETLTENEIAAFHLYTTGNKGIGNLFVTPLDVDDEGWDPDEVVLIQSGLDKTKGEGRGNSIVLDRAAQVKELGSRGQDMVLDKVNLIGKEKVFAVLNVDPAIVHADLGYNASKGTDKKQQAAIAWNNSLLPLAMSLCERLTLDILPEYGHIERERIGIDVTEVWALQDDENLRHTRYQQDFLAGILSQDEARAGIGQGPATPGEHKDGARFHPEFPQLINADPKNNLQNGTNGKLHNEESPQPVR